MVFEPLGLVHSHACQAEMDELKPGRFAITAARTAIVWSWLGKM